MSFLFLPVLLLVFLFGACKRMEKGKVPMLELLAPGRTGIDFRNDVPESLENNIFTYTNFYNGGGVAVGDINNDGLVDIYFSANVSSGKLYLNRGGFRFKDITPGSGMDSIPGWKTGVTMADVNLDGFLDIYICRSGPYKPRDRGNLLYINNGDLTFTEEAGRYGLDDWGISVQASFFDYDLDGDLDMYLMNNSLNPVRTIFRNFSDRDVNRYIGDKLFRNDSGYYTDVSMEAGINRSKLGDGLGIAVADLNNDLFPDIYISNDFAGRDYLYFNNGDGSFREKALESFEHISYSSMGNNAADVDNDGWQDLFELDMRNSSHYGRKTNMSAVNPGAFNLLIELNAHYQYMRNTFQLNNGNETFSDIAPLAGVSETDWSWSPLLVDLDNDGFKDLFVSNGMRKNTNNNDYIAYKDELILAESKKAAPDRASLVWEILEGLPEEKAVNLVFRNLNGFIFENSNERWGVAEPSFSNGAAYADFDNDGAMDLVCNNIDQVAHVYRNNAVAINGNHYLKVKLRGRAGNLNGLGARVMIQTGEEQQYLEQQVSRGYQSSVDYILHFGLGSHEVVDLLRVSWPDGRVSELTDVEVDRMVSVRQEDAIVSSGPVEKPKVIFHELPPASGMVHRHSENEFDDFSREVLLPHRMSTLGPALAVGDVNRDGLDDLFIGGARNDEGAVYLQQENGPFLKMQQEEIASDSEHEDTDALFFDADGDGDLDLYVVSGGNELPAGDSYYQDRLYTNDGRGHFVKSAAALPDMEASGGVVRTGDFDMDGDPDLFVGGRLLPGQYPRPGRSYLLENTGGRFRDVTESRAPDLESPGMVSDALWSDFNGDGRIDLIVVGEWMPVMFFRNDGGVLSKWEGDSANRHTQGWWFSIAEGDVNGDGRMDYILGNMGENHGYKANDKDPLRLYSHDFDNNGTLDIVMGYYENDTLYPVHNREGTLRQIPSLSSRFEDYHSFGSSNLQEIYQADRLEASEKYLAYTFSSSLMINGEEGFEILRLPELAQVSAVFGVIYDDFDDDGIPDIILAGNLYNTEMEMPRNDAGKGLFLKGDGQGKFKALRVYESGLFIPGDVKKLKALQFGKGPDARKGMVAGVNDGRIILISKQ